MTVVNPARVGTGGKLYRHCRRSSRPLFCSGRKSGRRIWTEGSRARRYEIPRSGSPVLVSSACPRWRRLLGESRRQAGSGLLLPGFTWLVEAEQQAVPGLVGPVVGLAGEVAQDGGDLLGVRGGDLGGERAERRLRGGGIVVSQPGRGAPVVLLGSAAYRAGSRGPDQARAREHLQVVGDVALVAAQGHGELADRRLALGEGEQQPVAHRMSQRLELLRGGHGGDIVVLHEKSVYIS